MFVLKQKWPANSTRPFLRRIGYAEPAQHTYESCGLDDATKFEGLAELFLWMEERGKKNFLALPDVTLVEVRAVPNPQYEEVRVLI